MTWLGPPGWVVLFALWVVPIAVSVWVLLDVTNLREDAFERAGTNRMLWIVLPIVGLFICMMSIVVALVWYFASRAGARGGGPGADERQPRSEHMSLGAPELLIILILWIIPIVLSLLVIIEAAGLPDAAFRQAGQSKTLWIVLPIVGLVFCIVSVVVAIVWFASVRARVRAAAAGA